MAEIVTSLSFQIRYNDKQYECDPIQRGNTTLYRVHFPTSPLYLVKAESAQGESFWTSIPEDFKLKAVVRELGTIIESQVRNNNN